MRFQAFLFLFLITNMLLAQDAFTEADARQVIDTFFEGFHEGDTIKMRSVMVPNLPTQSVYSTKDGKHMVSDSNGEEFLKAIANRAEDQRWDERLFEYKVQIDGNLAHVWTPYEFWYNGEFSHCGANSFTLAKTDDGWKIVHLIDSRRRSNCRDD